MLIGHFAAAFASKKASPGLSLGTLFAATQFLDLLWPVLVLAGAERVRVVPGITAVTPLDFISYPYSHSLLLAAAWATLFALPVYFIRSTVRGALVVWALVVSHWVLDWIAHRPDLPLVPAEGAARYGLGLWHSVARTLTVEALLFAFGLWLYLRVTRARDRVGVYALWSLVVVMSVVYVASLMTTPPDDSRALALSGLLQWVFVAWAFWADRHREPLAA
ncbi:MAG TPA: hypothetical protein VF521_13455 [Pyrinomonadaceae bacterium]